jgi:hypothetical protein
VGETTGLIIVSGTPICSCLGIKEASEIGKLTTQQWCDRLWDDWPNTKICLATIELEGVVLEEI